MQESESRVDFERELRLQLVRQAAAHSDHLAAVLQRNEAEVQQRYAEQLRVGVLEARGAARRDVVGAVARLHGIEAALDGERREPGGIGVGGGWRDQGSYRDRPGFIQGAESLVCS